MNYFNEQIAEALGAIKELAGTRVTYGRGPNSVVVTAVEGSSTIDASDLESVTALTKTTDFLIDVCELELNGDLIEPAKGDWIKVSRGTKVQTYIVQRPDNQQVFSYQDRGRTRYRINTTAKGSVNA